VSTTVFCRSQMELPTPSGLPFSRIYHIAVIASSIDSTTLRRCSIDCHSRGHFLAPNSTGSMISPFGDLMNGFSVSQAAD